jgi:hypothetical protein
MLMVVMLLICCVANALLLHALQCSAHGVTSCVAASGNDCKILLHALVECDRGPDERSEYAWHSECLLLGMLHAMLGSGHANMCYFGMSSGCVTHVQVAHEH